MMTEKSFEDGPIDDVQVRTLRPIEDERGWLCELYRRDEVDESVLPAMSYASMTRPNVARGPHEHRDQTDWICFVGPSDFLLLLWANRPWSATYRRRMRLVVGESNPAMVMIPPGVVHGYRNVGSRDGMVMNFPNRLYRGQGRTQAVDEIRHELDENTAYIIR